MFNKIFFLSVFSIGLVACGGSSGGGSATNTKSFETIETATTNIISQNGNKIGYSFVGNASKLANSPDNLSQGQIYFYDLKINVDGRIFDLGKGAELDLNQFNSGLSTKTVELTGKYKDLNGVKDISENAILFAYKQDDSGVIGFAPVGVEWGKVDTIIGNKTLKENVPNNGILTYKGSAFGYSNGLVRGDLVYQIDFDKNIGYGAIRGLTQNIIELQSGQIMELRSKDTNGTMIGISGGAREISDNNQIPLFKYGEGRYELGIFGANGNEIAGHTEAMTKNIVGYDNVLINGEPVEKPSVAWRAGLVGKAQ